MNCNQRILPATFILYSRDSSTKRWVQKWRLHVRALLIEDDAGVAKSIELMLKTESIYVYKTALGEEGVDLASRFA